MRLTMADVRRIRELRYGDGLTIAATAAEIGCSAGPIERYAPGWPGKVPNRLLREAFEASSLTAADVARRMGWWAGSGADSSRVKRALGLLADSNGRGLRSYRSRIDAETAYALADILGVDRWELEPDDAMGTRDR